MPQIYTNPKTGEHIRWDGRAWVPVAAPAAAPTASGLPSSMERLKAAARPPSTQELMMGGPGGAGLGSISRVAGAGTQALEEGSLRSEAAGHPVRAGLKRGAAAPLRMVESAARIGSGMTSVPPPSVMATGLALPAIADVVQGQKKGENQADRVERGLLGASQLAGLAAGAKGGGKGAAKYTNVAAELEGFRKMVEKKPAKGAMDVANTKHAELSAAIDQVWEPLHKALDAVPVNPSLVEKAIKKLRGVRPELDRWVEEMIPASESGQSQRAATWGEVKKLNEKLWELQGKDPVVSSLARAARAELSVALETTAKAAGLAKDYARARVLTRKMENVKFHTAYRAIRVAPAIWEIGGAALGSLMGEALGPAGMLGGMYAGHHLGRALGKRFVTETTYKVPKKSITAEGAIWGELGKPAPANLGKRRVRVEPQPAKPPSTTVGSQAGAKADTAYAKLARELLGPKASMSDVLKAAQAMKDAAGPPK